MTIKNGIEVFCPHCPRLFYIQYEYDPPVRIVEDNVNQVEGYIVHYVDTVKFDFYSIKCYCGDTVELKLFEEECIKHARKANLN